MRNPQTVCTGRPFLVKDTASARSIRLIVGNDDVAVSDIEHLEDLPHDCFSTVITYTMGTDSKVVHGCHTRKIWHKFQAHIHPY